MNTSSNSPFLHALKIVGSSACFLGLLASSVHAQNAYFDVNGTTAGYGTTAGGSYSWEDANWATASGGTSATANFVPGSFVRFVDTNSYTVTIGDGSTETCTGIFQAPASGSGNVLTINAAGSGNLSIAEGTLFDGLPVQGFLCGSHGSVIINAPITGDGGINYGNGGGGSISLYGNNTYAGGTTLTMHGTLINFTNGSAFGTGPIVIDTGNGFFCPLLGAGGTTITIANDWTNFSSGSGVNFALAANTPVVCTGAWALSANANIRNNGDATSPLTFAGLISGTGGAAFSGNNAGTIILSSQNTYSGATTLGSPATLKQGVANAFPYGAGTGTMTVSNGATLDLAGFDCNLNGFGSSSGGFINNSGANPVTLTIGNNNGGGTHSGVIKNTGGQLSLVKTGSGSIVLSGANTYTGKTTVSGGTITINTSGDACLGAAPASFVADQLTLDAGTLGLGTAANATLSANRGITLGAGGGTMTMSSKTLTVPGVVSGPGSLTKLGSSTLVLNAANTFSGGLNINQGTIDLDNDNAAGTGIISSTTVGTTTIRNTVASTITNDIVLNAGTGLLDIWSTTSLTLNGVISGAGGFVRGNGGGAGLLVLNGANTFSGGVTNAQGPLVLGNSAALGTGTLVIAPKSQSTTLIPSFSADTDLSGANAIANAINVQAGTAGSGFAISGTNNIEFSGAITLATSPAITNNNSAITKLSGVISGTGFGVTFGGTGTTILTATETYDGPTAVVGGALQVDGSLTASSSVTVTGGTLKGNGTVPATTINTGGSINPGASPGTLSVAGALTWNGGSYVWEVNDFNGIAGANPGWDVINADTLTVAGAFTIAPTALSPGSDNFDANSHFDRVILHTTNGITGDLSQVTVDTSAFDAMPAGGLMFVAAVTNIDNSVDLVLEYRFGAGITGQPTSTTTCIGANAVFGISPNFNSDDSLTYQWQKDGVNLTAGTQPSGSSIADVTATNLQIIGVQTADAGNYTCVVSGPYSSTVTSAAASLTVPIAPVIATPASASTSTVNAGDTVNLDVTLSAGSSVTYQWQKNGVNLTDGAYDNGATISGAATPDLTVAGVRTVDAGDYTCNVVADGGCGAATSLATTVIVVDPAITQQPVDSTFECGSSNALTVTAIGSTNADGVLTYQWYSPDPSGTAITDATNAFLSFPTASFANAGSYSVVVSNAFGNSITSSVVVVTVVDTTVPVLTVNGTDATVECHGSYTDAGATATDTCDANPAVTTDGLPDVNTVGNYTVTYTATDATGNSSTAIRLVTVQDTTAPVITLTGAPALTISCGSPYTDAGATATDVCAGDLTSQIVVNLGGLNPSAPLGGDYTITYNVQDPSLNAATPVTRLVHVVDNSAPVISVTGASPVTVECHSSYTDAGATASDDCAGAITPTTTGSVDANTVGAYTLTYTATDGVNTTTATRVVNVTDTTAPVITLNGAAAITNECHAAYSDPGASASDDCDTNASVAISGTVDLDTVGVYTRTYTATDASGNSSTTTREITVSDTTAPVITVTGGDQTVECHTSYTDAGATATDACDSNPSVISSGSVDANTVGSYTLTYSSTDASGNNSTATRTVTVADSTAPVVTLTGAASVTVECHSGFTDPGATATDTCDASPIVATTGLVDANTPGVYTLTYTASDATGNTSSTTRTVTVNDTAAPIVTLNGTSPIAVECHGSFSDTGATATDGCDGSLAVTTSGTVDPNTVGSYTLTYSASDSTGNTASAILVVNVSDTAAPVITVTGGDQTIECHSSFTDAGATAADACQGDMTGSITTTGTVDANTVGVYTLTYSVGDASGNNANATRTVTVQDTTAPVVTLAGSATDNACLGGSYSDPGASATDACDSNPNVATSGSVDTATAGDYTLTYTATDAAGNSASVTRVVTVAPCAASITGQPASTTVNATSSFTLTVTAGPEPITYQWKKNGVAIADATNSTYYVTNVFRANAGTYTVDVTAGLGVTTSDPAVVTVIDPVFTINPASATVSVGVDTQVTFLAVAQGTPTLKYQWYYVGTNNNTAKLSNATTQLVVHVTQAAGGSYYCKVTSGTQNATSAMATLTVYQRPTILSNPAKLTKFVGQNATFKVTAGPTKANLPGYGGPIQYQWVIGTSNSYTPLVESAHYVGTTNPVLTIVNVQTNDSSVYSCYVYNSAPINVFSMSGQLTVNDYSTAPIVVIMKPGAHTRTNVADISVSGTVTDKGYVTNVFLTQITSDVTNSLDSGTNIQSLIFTTNLLASDMIYKTNVLGQQLPGNVRWTNAVTLVPGTNLFTVTAIDEEGNVGTNKPVRSVFYKVPQSLTLVTTGTGAVLLNNKPATGANIFQGIRYTLKAMPKPNTTNTFVGWTDGDGNPFSGLGTDASSATLHFMMPGTNMTIRANFN